jgi:hypothetical protein
MTSRRAENFMKHEGGAQTLPRLEQWHELLESGWQGLPGDFGGR